MGDMQVISGHPSRPTVERATIEPLAVRKGIPGISRTTWCFVVRTDHGRDLFRSYEFLSATNHPTNKTREQQALQELLLYVRDDGWTITHRPKLQARDQWWQFRFVKGDPEAVARDLQYANAMSAGSQWVGDRPKMARGVWTMWSVTLVVIIGLFLLCVVLVLTAEIRVSPAQ
jgi:hypothetical protein